MTNIDHAGRALWAKLPIPFKPLVALAFASLAYALPVGGQPGRPIIDRDPATVTRGEAVFAANCSPCHGKQAVGQNPAKPMGGKQPDGSYLAPALNGTGHSFHHPPKRLLRIIRQGSKKPGSPMLGWKGRLPDEEIWAAISYFQSRWQERDRRRYDKFHRTE